ncbi:hypothetical protein MMC27_007999 [Xylographa pallens]|nr:hypothetical protein [Xylographa pallens]
MLYSNLLTRKSAVVSILFSVALASPAPQNGVTGTSLGAAAVPVASATAMPTCLGVGASVIPPLGPGPNPGAADNMGFDSGSDGSDDSSATARRDLLLGEMNNFLYERQDASAGASDGSMGASDGSMGASDGSTGASDGSTAPSDSTPMTGGPIQIPPNTTYCGWLGGMGMQSDMLIFNPGTYQLTWQNVTGDGQVSINYAEAGADSSWANQDADTPDEWPTIVSFPNDGIQYQVVYYGEYAANGLSWFMTQVG